MNTAKRFRSLCLLKSTNWLIRMVLKVDFTCRTVRILAYYSSIISYPPQMRSHGIPFRLLPPPTELMRERVLVEWEKLLSVGNEGMEVVKPYMEKVHWLCVATSW